VKLLLESFKLLWDCVVNYLLMTARINNGPIVHSSLGGWETKV